MSEQKNKRPMTASDYIKNQPHLQGKPLTIQNKFTALAEYPPLSYSKAAAPSTSAKQPENTQKSTYFLKPHKQHILTTQYTKPTTLKELTTYTFRTFYEDALYSTDDVTKNRTFYEYILVDSKSVEITHFPDKTNPNQIAYSTCKILRVHSIKDLGFLHHHTIKPFSTPGYHKPGYTYVDYNWAFFRTFYLRPYDHSWFISFDRMCPKGLPGWFAEWWYWFSPTTQIYPSEITKTSLPYYIKHAPQHPTTALTTIYFHIDMGVPWICSWHFNLIPYLENMPFSLVREFRIKWWEKYNLERCSLASMVTIWSLKKRLKCNPFISLILDSNPGMVAAVGSM